MTTFYNIDAITIPRSVMVVSDKNCVDMLQPIYSGGMAVISWPEGVDAPEQTEIPDALLGKKIILWPSNDEASIKSMRHLATRITNRLESANISIVNTDGFSEKYSVADFISEGNGRAAIEAMVKPRLEPYNGNAPERIAIQATNPIPTSAALVNEVLTAAKSICTAEGFTMNELMDKMNISFHRRNSDLMNRVMASLRTTGYVSMYGRRSDEVDLHLWYKRPASR